MITVHESITKEFHSVNQVFGRKYSEQAVSKLRKVLFLPYNALLAIQDAKNQLNSLHIYREKETFKRNATREIVSKKKKNMTKV